MVKEIIVAVVGGSVVALAGYLLGVKENQVNITHIKQELQDIKEIGKNNQDSLVATKLFVAQAHPNRDASTLASIVKLQKLNKNEVEILARSLSDVKIGPGPNNELVKIPVNLKDLAEKYNLNGNDFASFTAVANMPKIDHQL